MISLIKNEAGLRIKDWLVITDVHLGYEKELRHQGYSIPSQAESMLERIKRMKGDSKRLVILGDLKHKVPGISWQEEREVPFFIEELEKEFKEVIILKGNHDGQIETLIPNAKVQKSLMIDDALLMHGHQNPEGNHERIIAGHTHPCFKLKNHLGISQNLPCWIVTPKIIIMPCFNKLFAGSNETIGPLSKLIKEKEILLLDHTKVE